MPQNSVSSQLLRRDIKRARREANKKNSLSGRIQTFLENHQTLAIVGGLVIGLGAIIGSSIAGRFLAGNSDSRTHNNLKPSQPKSLPSHTPTSTNSTHHHLNNSSHANINTFATKGNDATTLSNEALKTPKVERNESASKGFCLSDPKGIETLDPFQLRVNEFQQTFPPYLVKGFGGATKMAEHIDLRNNYCNGSDIDPASLTKSITFHQSKEDSSTYFMTFLLAMTNNATKETTYVTDTSYVFGFARGLKNVKTNEDYRPSIIASTYTRITNNDFKFYNNLMAGKSLPLRRGSWETPKENVVELEKRGGYIDKRYDHPRMKKQLQKCLSRPEGSWCKFVRYDLIDDNFTVRLADPSELKLHHQARATSLRRS